MKKAKRILLVEDDPKDIELTLAALAEHKLVNEVAVVNDGEQALDYLHRRGKFARRTARAPVVVLLDLKMPKVDGLEVLRQLKGDVVLTSSREERDVIQSYQLGANAYVVKPVDFDKFVEAVKQLRRFWVLVNEPPPGGRGKP